MELLIAVLAIVFGISLLIKSTKSAVLSFSRLMFNLNTLVVGGGTAFILYVMLLNKYHWLISVIIGMFLIGGIKALADSENMIVSRAVYAVYGIADGLLVGYLISHLALHVSLPTTKAVFTYLASVIGMLYISYLGYYQTD